MKSIIEQLLPENIQYGDNPESKGIEVREEYKFDICLRIEGFSEDEPF